MSEEERTTGPGGMILIGVVAAVLLALYLAGGFSRDFALNRSAVGFDGLGIWLRDNGRDAFTSYGRGRIDPDVIGLRVLPLHDVDLNDFAPPASGRQERLLQQTERDIAAHVVYDKIELLPTLIVLPKWRRGARELGVTHPDLLVDQDRVAGGVLGQLPVGRSALHRGGDPDFMLRNRGRELALPYVQYIEAARCTPVIGAPDRMLLAECTYDGIPYWILSDPDLMNNHGLALGDNAAAALDIVDDLAAEGAVMVDASTFAQFIWDEPEGRTWADLLRFFAFPFSILWLGFGALAALVLWRAWRRFGPADAAAEEETGSTAAQEASIDVKARLLRLTGHDAAVVRAFIEDRLHRLAADVVGPARGREHDPMAALMRSVRRRKPELAHGLEEIAAPGFVSDDASAERLLACVDRVEELIERTMNEFGRAQDGR